MSDNINQEEYRRFTNWLHLRFGMLMPSISARNYKSSPEYKLWVAEGRMEAPAWRMNYPHELMVPQEEFETPFKPEWLIEPGAAKYKLSSFYETPSSPAPPYSTLNWATMSEEERDSAMRNPDIPLSTYGIEAPEGKEYVFVDRDPETGFPLGENAQWVLQDVAGEVPFPDVVSRGGYDFMPIYDLEGNIVGYERIGETPTTEADKLSAWERAQLGLSEAELGLSYAQLEEERQARLAGLMAQPSDWIKRWYAMQSGQYPEAPKPWYTKGGGLAGVAGWEAMTPEERGNWIDRYKYSQWANLHPDIQRQVQMGYGFPKALPGQGISYGEEFPGFEEAPQDKYPYGTFGEAPVKPSGEVIIKGVPELTPEQYGQQELARWTGKPTSTFTQQPPWQTFGARGGAPAINVKTSPTGETSVNIKPDLTQTRFGGGQIPVKTAPGEQLVGAAPPKTRRGGAQQPSAPPTTEWLAQFAPWLTTGEPISPGAIPTPSGQLWGRTPWSVREGLRGFAEFAGGRPLIDIEEHLAMMLPEEPRGAGYGRWRPAMQV